MSVNHTLHVSLKTTNHTFTESTNGRTYG